MFDKHSRRWDLLANESPKAFGMMRSFLSSPICTVLLLLSATAQVRAIDDIKPPFGLSWGESADRLERLLKGAKAKIVERRKLTDGREAWYVEGLIQPGLQRTLFYFRGTQLVEVELQYQKRDWDQSQYDDYMVQVRNALDRRYGAGQLLTRKTEPAGDVLQTVVGWKWNHNNAAIEMFYYSAENPQQVFRTLSVHYKTY
jgi:hypothetical protein